MARSKSSSRWLAEHVNDPFVKRAQVDGYRARSAYKLLELNEKDRLIRPGMVVLDLGATPGSWSQIAAKMVGAKGRVIASDILAMEPLAKVDFIQGDFTEQIVFDQILEQLGADKADIVICDMSPNISGVDSSDQARAMYLSELALDMARKVLKPKGDFAVKVFQGEGFDGFVKDARTSFEKMNTRKPAASRPRSREVYLVFKGFKG